jgi:hypothetical protein
VKNSGAAMTAYGSLDPINKISEKHAGDSSFIPCGRRVLCIEKLPLECSGV